MRRTLPFDFVYQAIALVVATIAVHLVYATWRHPSTRRCSAGAAPQSLAVNSAHALFEVDLAMPPPTPRRPRLEVQDLFAGPMARTRARLPSELQQIAEGLGVLPSVGFEVALVGCEDAAVAEFRCGDDQGSVRQVHGQVGVFLHQRLNGA